MKELIKRKLELLTDESRNKTLKELKAIKHIGIDEQKNTVVLIITIGELRTQAEKKLRQQIAKIIKLELNFDGVKIQLEEEKRLINNKTKFILIASNKGGVGKSTITINLAHALAKQGKKVGIIDADFYGASIPSLLQMDITTPDINTHEQIKPYQKNGIEVMSIAFFAEKNKPVLWRGSAIESLLSNFFRKVSWDKDTDFMLVDMPNGTGDVLMDIKTFIPSAIALLVTTPHALCASEVIKAGVAFQQSHTPILGVIENMSYLLTSETKLYPFGQGGGSLVADFLQTDLLTRLPLQKPANDSVFYEAPDPIASEFDDIASLLIIQ